MFPRTLQTAMNGDENDNQEPVEMPLIEGAPPLSHSTDIPQLSIPSSSDEASYPVYSHSPLILPSSRMTREPFDDTGLDLSLIEGTVYPFEEERHRRVGLVASVVIHLFLAAVVLLAAWFFGIRSLRQFMAGPVHQSPPPDSIQVVLLQDDEIPPPPTPHPEFIIQKLIQPPAPKPLVIKPPPPKPPPPRPVVQHKAIKAAPTPAVATNSASNSGALKVVVGSGSFPAPDYPPEADLARIQGDGHDRRHL